LDGVAIEAPTEPVRRPRHRRGHPSISGPALAERIAAIRPDVPVLFMSGYEAGSLPAGSSRPLAKPFTAFDLADAVGALFGRSH
jgi:hypothetical protein